MKSGVDKKVKVGEYLIVEKSGQGSFSTVFRAEDVGGRAYALKRIAIENISEQVFSYVRNEIEISMKIEHPHIVKIIEVIRTTKNLYIVMEYCEGLDLKLYLKNHGKIRYDIAKRLFKEIISGLIYLKQQNILHRDLKPANLLLSSTDIDSAQVKICDFGFAKMLKDSAPSSLIGSPLYRAPEVYLQKPYTFKSDIWSLGITFYEILYGIPPINGLVLHQVITTGLIELDFNSSENSQESVESLIRSMLSSNPEQRPEIEQLLDFNFFTEEHIDISIVEISKKAVERSIEAVGGLNEAPTFINLLKDGLCTQMNLEQFLTRYSNHWESIEKFLVLALSYNDDENLRLAIMMYLKQEISEEANILCDIQTYFPDNTKIIELLNRTSLFSLEELFILVPEIYPFEKVNEVLQSLFNEINILRMNDNQLFSAILLAKVGVKITKGDKRFLEMLEDLLKFQAN